MSRVGIPFVVSAPSGTGKTTLCREVLARDRNVTFSISHTTRAPRNGERDGVDYHFVDPAEFRSLAEEGRFLEWAHYRGHEYGTSWEAIESPLAQGRDVLIEIEVQGARQVRKRRADARFIFILPPSRAVLEQRLRNRRTDAPDAIERRLEAAQDELRAVHMYDYAVVNDDLEEAIESTLEIIRAEREGATEGVRARFACDETLKRHGSLLDP